MDLSRLTSCVELVKNRFQVGRLYAQSWKSFDALSQIRLDVRGASPRSSASQGYFRHALVAKCTNRFASEEGFRHALVAKCTKQVRV